MKFSTMCKWVDFLLYILKAVLKAQNVPRIKNYLALTDRRDRTSNSNFILHRSEKSSATVPA